MKKIVLFFMCCAIFSFAVAQTSVPQTINYQGVARNSSGQPLANQAVTVKTTISGLAGIVPINYIETRTVTTNAFGLFSFQIGSPGASSTNGPFISQQFWLTLSDIRIRVEIATGSNPLVLLGETSFASVPYALAAGIAHPWNYNATNKTVYPEDDSYNVGLGVVPLEKLHVRGNVRIDNGNLGIGTATATEKLHVAGNIRMVDGQQGNGKILTGNATGVASWQTLGDSSADGRFLKMTASGRPVWKRLATNNPGDGTFLTSDLNGNFTWKRLATNNPGDGTILTSDTSGNLSWKPLTDNLNFQWVTTNYPVSLDGGTPFRNKKISLKPLFYEYLNGGAIINRFSTFDINNLDTFQVQATKNIFTSNNTIFKGSSSGEPNSNTTYPVQISSSGTLGMSISLDGGVPNQRKYVTFFSEGNVKGRIEGQTVADLVVSRPYIMFNFFHTVLLTEYAAEVVAAGLQLDIAETVVNGVAATAMGVEWATEVGYWQDEAGISYESGSGDYAEWLERANPSEKVSYGDIVEVIGGKISKTITGKGQLMVISMAPIVLGNMPEPGKQKFSEKVAFMGQVPVKVTGDVSIGDYIISSGNNDGIGYAVHPADITPEEYKSMVGVAWSKSSGKMISLINTAVGLQTNALVNMVKKQEQETSVLKAQMNQLGTYLAAKDPAFKYETLSITPSAFANKATAPVIKASTTITAPVANGKKSFDIKKYAATLNAAKVKQLLADHPEAFTATWKYFQEAIIEQAKMQHVDLNKTPELKRLVYNQDAFIDTIKKVYGII